MSKSIQKIAVSDLGELYPGLINRGLTNDRIEALVEWDVIGGIPSDENSECFVFKETFELFLAYHNDLYQYRIKATGEGIKALNEKRRIQEEQKKNGI